MEEQIRVVDGDDDNGRQEEIIQIDHKVVDGQSSSSSSSSTSSNNDNKDKDQNEDNDSNDFSTGSRLKDLFFGVLFLLNHDRPLSSSLLDYAILVIEDLQMIGWAFLPSLGIPHLGVWPRAILNILGFRASYAPSPDFEIVFSLAATLVILVLFLLLWLAFNFNRGNFNLKFSISVTRVLAMLTSTVLYAPVLDTLLVPLNYSIEFPFSNAPSSILTIIGPLIAVLIHLPVTLALNGLFFRSNPTLKGPDTRLHGRWHLIYTCLKSILVLMWRLGLPPPANLSVSLLSAGTSVCMAVSLVSLWYLIPYFDNTVNAVRFAFHATALCCSLVGTSNALAQFLQQNQQQIPDNSYASMAIIFFLLIVTWPLSFHAFSVHLRSICSNARAMVDGTSKSSIQNGVFARWPLVEASCRFLTRDMNARISFFNQEKDFPSFQQLFHRGEAEFGTCNLIPVAQTLYLFAISNGSFFRSLEAAAAPISRNLLHALHHSHKQVKRLDPAKTALDTQFQIYLINRSFLQRHQEESLRHLSSSTSASASASKKIDVAQYAEFKKKEKMAETACSTFKKLIKNGWKTVLKKDYDIQSLASITRSAYAASIQAETLYTELVRRNPNNAPLLRAYATFLVEIKGQPYKAKIIVGKADKLDEEASRARKGAAAAHSTHIFAGSGSNANFTVGSRGDISKVVGGSNLNIHGSNLNINNAGGSNLNINNAGGSNLNINNAGGSNLNINGSNLNINGSNLNINGSIALGATSHSTASNKRSSANLFPDQKMGNNQSGSFFNIASSNSNLRGSSVAIALPNPDLSDLGPGENIFGESESLRGRQASSNNNSNSRNRLASSNARNRLASNQQNDGNNNIRSRLNSAMMNVPAPPPIDQESSERNQEAKVEAKRSATRTLITRKSNDLLGYLKWNNIIMQAIMLIIVVVNFIIVFGALSRNLAYFDYISLVQERDMLSLEIFHSSRRLWLLKGDKKALLDADYYEDRLQGALEKFGRIKARSFLDRDLTNAVYEHYMTGSTVVEASYSYHPAVTWTSRQNLSLFDFMDEYEARARSLLQTYRDNQTLLTSANNDFRFVADNMDSLHAIFQESEVKGLLLPFEESTLEIERDLIILIVVQVSSLFLLLLAMDWLVRWYYERQNHTLELFRIMPMDQIKQILAHLNPETFEGIEARADDNADNADNAAGKVNDTTTSAAAAFETTDDSNGSGNSKGFSLHGVWRFRVRYIALFFIYSAIILVFSLYNKQFLHFLAQTSVSVYSIGRAMFYGAKASVMATEIAINDLDTWKTEARVKANFQNVFGKGFRPALQSIVYGDPQFDPPAFGLDDYSQQVRERFTQPSCLRLNQSLCDDHFNATTTGGSYVASYGFSKDIAGNGLLLLTQALAGILDYFWRLCLTSQDEFSPTLEDRHLFYFLEQALLYDYVDGYRGVIGLMQDETRAQQAFMTSLNIGAVVLCTVTLVSSYLFITVYMTSHLRDRNFQIADFFLTIPEDVIANVPELNAYMRSGDLAPETIEQIKGRRYGGEIGGKGGRGGREKLEKKSKSTSGKRATFAGSSDVPLTTAAQ